MLDIDILEIAIPDRQPPERGHLRNIQCRHVIRQRQVQNFIFRTAAQIQAVHPVRIRDKTAHMRVITQVNIIDAGTVTVQLFESAFLVQSQALKFRIVFAVKFFQISAGGQVQGGKTVAGQIQFRNFRGFRQNQLVDISPARIKRLQFRTD